MEYDFNQLPIAGTKVSGLTVMDSIPNENSISASLNHYEILPGIREVSMDFFTYNRPYSDSELKRTEKLKKQIEENLYIHPLIVVWDNEGLYILEGSHRFDALFLMNIKSFPALVVKDLE